MNFWLPNNSRRETPLCINWHIAMLGLGNYEGGRLWVESPVGTDPPPCAANSWQKALRGEYMDVRDRWVQFDPQLYYCVERVTRGERRSIALFSPRSWKRFPPPHCLDELIDVGFCPPFSAQDAESKETALPLDGSLLLSLPWLRLVRPISLLRLFGLCLVRSTI